MLRGGVGGVILLACALSACSGPQTEATASARSASPSSAASASTVPSSAPSPNAASPSMATCSPDVVDSVRATITGQQRAFAAGDFAGARDFSSRDFRAGVTVAQFEVIITIDYGFLLDDPSLDFASCVGQPGVAFMTVAVGSDPPVVMAYRVVEEADDWFIDSAGVIEWGGSIQARGRP